MELTSTQFRAITKALMLLLNLIERMTPDERNKMNEIVSDWADLKLHQINDNPNREDVREV